jgi:hypothetical protein
VKERVAPFHFMPSRETSAAFVTTCKRGRVTVHVHVRLLRRPEV